ncbi:hypothetical protein [Planotetraspora kaengkrachanensis]|uniref:RNA polymerase sigma factor 70 region 4 type 2 domain-containing protein n=1 Tax=Planotetraspora kaengkrachanensis TaxID=575193 RepID=A0A8J3V7S1_9ACTN|nr:hypothetical protein [Planotetraspora kaengkrachanensis]GIG82315.1 hypothetical protein Pka01_54420 [Planotetraspora kaengkrachanensis]
MNVPPGARPFPNAPTGAAARDLPGFDAFAADQAPALARTAFLLTGDGRAARLLVVAAVTSVANRWSTLRWSSPARAATRELFAAFLTRPPKAVPIVTRPPSGEPGTWQGARQDDEGLLPLAEALGALTPRRRALIVARFHVGVPVELAAALCRVDVRTAWAEIGAALSELIGRLPVLTAAPGPAPASAAPAEPLPAEPLPAEPDESGATEAPAAASMATREGAAGPEPASTPWAAPEPSSSPWAPPAPQSARWAAPEQRNTPAASWAPPAPPVPHSGPHGVPAGPHGVPAGPPPVAATRPPVAAPPHARPHPAPLPGPLVAEDPAHEALRRHIHLLAAQAPAVDVPGVTGEILRTARRRRIRRRVVGATAGITVAALVGTAVIAGMSALVDGVRDSARRADPGLQAIDDGGDHGEDGGARSKLDDLPGTVAGSFQYAYRPYCDPDDSMFGEETGDCTSWRVLGGAVEWRIPDAETRADRALFAISSNGHRLAYYDTRLSSLVMADVDDTRPQTTDLVPDPGQMDYGTDLLFSPKGRWLAVDFGQDRGAPAPRLHDFSTHRTWPLPLYMDLLAVSDDGTVTATMTDDVKNEAGRVHTTTLVRMRPDGHVLSRVRVEPELFDNGEALSGDGRVLALSVESAHPRDDGQNRLVMLDARTGKVRALLDAALPMYTYIDDIRGWVNDREVLVDVSDDDDEYYTYVVDVTTGSVREISDTAQYGTTEVWAAGTLE